MRATWALVLLGLAVLLGCDGSAPAAGDPTKPSLAFTEVPAAARLKGRFRVAVRVNDASGRQIDGDSATRVSIRAEGSGRLTGTLERTAAGGVAVFDDLSYDMWEGIRLSVSAEGKSGATTPDTIPVRPIMRFARTPPQRLLAGEPMDPVVIELVDGLGGAVELPQSVRIEPQPELVVPGGYERSLKRGVVTFESVTFGSAGGRTLEWTSPGLAKLLHAVTVYSGQRERGLWLPAARVGLAYHAALDPSGSDFRVIRGALPDGLELDPDGKLHGVPSEAEIARFDVLATSGGAGPWLSRAELAIFPAREATGPSLDALDAAGPFAVARFDDAVDVPSRKVRAPIRVFHPEAGGAVASGVFPLVVFHHGAGLVDDAHPRLFDRYDHFLRRWASYGFVVVSVDATDLVWEEGRFVPGTLANINTMAENLRAVIASFRARNDDPKSPFAGHVNANRVIAAGHSRGAAAALTAARAEATVVGAILIKPLDPMTPTDGVQSWSGPLPAKPLLIVSAGNDGDVPFPMVDTMYERRAGPTVAVTIVGSIHYFSCAEGGPNPVGTRFDEGRRADIARAEDWAVTNAYSVAFLRWAALGELADAERLFGRAALTSRLSSAGVLVRTDRRADAVVVDDFQSGLAGRNRLGLPNSAKGMTVSVDEPWLLAAVHTLPEIYQQRYQRTYERPEVLAMTSAHRLEWSQGPASFRSELGGLDATGRASFVFRARSLGTQIGGGSLRVVFTDAAGLSTSVRASGHLGDAAIGDRFSDVVIPLGSASEGGADLAHLAAVEIAVEGKGAMLVDDLRFE